MLLLALRFVAEVNQRVLQKVFRAFAKQSGAASCGGIKRSKQWEYVPLAGDTGLVFQLEWEEEGDVASTTEVVISESDHQDHDSTSQ